MVEHFEVADEDRRIFKAWATVEVKDSQGEIIPVSELDAYAPVFVDRGPPLLLEHENIAVGKIINVIPTKKNGKAAWEVWGKVNADTQTESVVWNDLKNGKYGVSIAGEFETQVNTAKGKVLKGFKAYEVSLTKTPANPEANIIAANMTAKSDSSQLQNHIIKADEILSAIKQNNPWAICTATLGTQEGEKFERCVQDLKEQLGMKGEKMEDTKKDVKVEETKEQEAPEAKPTMEDFMKMVLERLAKLEEKLGQQEMKEPASEEKPEVSKAETKKSGHVAKTISSPTPTTGTDSFAVANEEVPIWKKVAGSKDFNEYYRNLKANEGG